MTEIEPALVFGCYIPGDWLSRYARFEVDLPQGRHVLAGRTYNPPGEDLIDNCLQIVIRQRVVGEVRSATTAGWCDFAVALPEVEGVAGEPIVLRTTRFRSPPPPDQRVLGLLLDRLVVQLVSA
jgi:hypothetical protein